nr:hypothetical protein [Tanacetum cinerariifolium]
MNMLNNKCRTSFAKPEFLKKSQRANPRLFDIGCYNDNLAIMLALDSDEVIRLEKESRSKLSDLIRPFYYDKLNNLYDLFVPQREKSSEQRYFSERSRLSHMNVNNGKSKESFIKQSTLLEERMDESIPLDKQCQSSLEIFKVKSCLNEEMVANLRYFNSLELKVDSLRSQLESQKTQFLNEIDRLSREYYYAYYMNAILGLETELSKSKMMSNSFESVQKHAINLELDLQQCKEKIKNDMLFKVNKSKDFCKEREQYFEIQDMKAQLQDKGIVISELKKLIEKLKGKSVDNKFEKSSVIRQPNAFKSQRPLVLGKPTTFLNSFVRKGFSKSTLVTQTHVSNDFSKPVTAQTLPTNKKSILKNTNVLSPGMYKLHTDHTQTRTSQLPQDSRKTNKRVSFSTGVILTTSVSRPPLKSNPLGDRVMHKHSRGKKREVEDQCRSVTLSKNKTSVTACNDSLNAKTLNVKYVSAKCDKCVLIDKHDMCVLKSVAKPLKETVALKSNKTPRNFTRRLYECVSKTCNWWYPKFTPSGYKWKPKSRKENVNMNETVALKSNKTPRNFTRKLFERVSKTCSWWYPKFTPSGYKWKPKSRKENVNMNLIEIVVFIVDSGCSKHMTGNLKLLINFVEKFVGTVKFGNDQIAPILGFGDLVQGAVTIKRVYYVEGLNHNLFSVGQFCDADLEVAFRKSTCYIRDLKGNDILTGSRGMDLYSITLQDTNCPNLICLMAKETSSQAWLWHRRLSHLNFNTINLLSKKDIVVGLPKMKFVKDHLCSSCELGKAKQNSFHTKLTQAQKVSYNFYTWTYVVPCGSKDETPKVLIDFLRLVQRGLQAQVRVVRTDKGIEFLNQTLLAYFAVEGIHHQTSVARTPEQNGFVESCNRTFVEAARTMLSATKVPIFFWAEAIATACFTQNRSLVIPRHEKTPYHIINDQKPSVKFFHIFGSSCYIVKDGEFLDKIKEKRDECIFVGYSTRSRAYRVFNKRIRVIMESIHVNFDELPQMASDQLSSDPTPECQTMALNHDSLSPANKRQANVPQADRIVTTSNELNLLFSLMFDELLNGSSKVMSKSFVVSTADALNQRQQYTTPLNNHTTPTPTCQVSPHAPTVTSFENINQAEVYATNDQVADDEFINIFSTSVPDQGETSLRHVDSSNMHTFYQRYPSEHRWTKDHPLEQVIGNPLQSVITRRQLELDAEMCMFALT